VKDSTSKEVGNQDGVSNCGDRIYTITTPSQVTDLITYDSSTRIVNLSSDVDAPAGEYQVEVVVSLR
jgi:hypothetical protein